MVTVSALPCCKVLEARAEFSAFQRAEQVSCDEISA